MQSRGKLKIFVFIYLFIYYLLISHFDLAGQVENYFDRAGEKIILAGGGNYFGRWENNFGRWENYFGRWKIIFLRVSVSMIYTLGKVSGFQTPTFESLLFKVHQPKLPASI